MNERWQVPATWQWTNMAAVSTVIGGGTPSTQDPSHFGGDVPWLTPADLSGFGDKYISSGERNLTQRGFERSSAKMVPAGSILFTSRAPVGYVAIAEAPVCTNQGFKSFVLAPDIVPSYCYYYLLSARTHIQSMASGTTFLELPAREARKIPIPIAPKQEQSRIAVALDETLSDLNAGIDTLQRCQEKLARYRASVLKAAVEGDLTAAWRKEHPDIEPASELLQRILAERRQRWEQEQLRIYAEKGKAPPKNWKAKYKEPVAPEGNDLPTLAHGWCWATLDQLAWSSGYGTSVKCKPDNAGLAVLRIPNVVQGALELDNLKFAPSGYAEAPDRLVAARDMLVIRTNGSRDLIGRGAFVQHAPSIALSFASYLIRFRLIGAVEWLSVLWDSHLVRRWVSENCATSAGQYNISLRTLNKLPLPIPPLEEQTEIVAATDELMSVSSQTAPALESQLAAAERLRQSILYRAFTGHLLPQDPSDEPASKLLERIANEREARQRQKPKRHRV